MSPWTAAVAAHGLRDAAGAWPGGPLDPQDWDDLLQHARQQRLTGLLSKAVLDGALPATPEQQVQAQGEHLDGVCASLLLESGTLRVLGLLAAADVPAKVLKGPAVAHLDYPEPSLRLFGDIDLLVPAEAFDRGVEALKAAGYLRRYPQPRPGFDRRFSKGTSFNTPDHLEVDYHRVFAMGPFGLRLRQEDLWSGARTFVLGGQQVQALDDETRFLHACFHTALGNKVPRLAPQRDVAQMLENDRFDLERVRHLTHRWGAQPVVAFAVAHTVRTLQLDSAHPLVPWALGFAYDRRARFELAVYRDPDGGYAGKSLSALLALPSWRDRLAFARALALPEHAYIEDRYASAGTRWRRGLQAARRLRATP